MTQKEAFLKMLPCTQEAVIKSFLAQGWAKTSAYAVAWQLKKARKIKRDEKGIWKRATKRK